MFMIETVALGYQTQASNAQSAPQSWSGLALNEVICLKCIRDVLITYADISKAEKLFGYKPNVKIEEGIKPPKKSADEKL